MRRLLLALGLGFLLPLAACNAEIPPETLAAIRAGHTLLLDVRTPAEFAAGHLDGARLVAEQFAFHHRLGQRAGVDRDEGPLLAHRQIVQGARHHFLARAGFTEDQHVGVNRRQCADLLAQAQHRRGLADQARAQLIAVGQGQAQAAVLQHQTAQFQRAMHGIEQRLAGERFLEEIVGSGAHRLHRQRHIAVAGDQQHR